MKLFKKLLCLALAVCLLGLLAACGGDTDSEDTVPTGDPAYRVTVTDFLGTPMTEGVVVGFQQNGQQVAMQMVNGEGVAEKVLPRGDYTVALMFTDSSANYYYDEANLTLSGENTELTVRLARIPGGDTVTVTTNNTDYEAYNLQVGCYQVPLTAGQRSYFLFNPTEAGTYEFSVMGEDLVIGYYGMPHFIQANCPVEVVNNRFTISVSADMISTSGMGGSVLVIGVDSAAAESCILSVRRAGEAEWTVEDEPWTNYTPTAALAPYTLPAGAQIREFDLTARYTLVFNEADGFYHKDSADGPLVLVRLGENGKYLDCFKTILENSGVCKYFFDEKGDFVKKESYDQCLLEYIQYMDEDSGLYPLTEDLKYIIQQRGEYAGWFDTAHPFYLFKDENGSLIPGIDPETSWLFMCCYLAD